MVRRVREAPEGLSLCLLLVDIGGVALKPPGAAG
jgi:hypothetical protein